MTAHGMDGSCKYENGRTGRREALDKTKWTTITRRADSIEGIMAMSRKGIKTAWREQLSILRSSLRGHENFRARGGWKVLGMKM